jgi:hypothetical protein
MEAGIDGIAPCGIDCVNCEVYAATITPALKARMAAAMSLDQEKVPCRGCRTEKGCRLHFTRCDTLDCVTAKGHDFCHECAEFPCGMLQPAADRADRLPHNLKVFNLCRIKSVGAAAWLAQEARVTREKYYRGTMIVGKGPALEKKPGAN